MPRLRLWLLALAICSCHVAMADNQLAIIIDDIGYNKKNSERAAQLSGAFTLSVLPFTPFASSSAQLAHRNHKELMLHVPMSNLKNLPLGKGGLNSQMDKPTLLAILRKDLDDVPFIKGINNHMGSRLTQVPTAMAWVMEELKQRELYFVDSRTTALTVALETAQHYRVPSIKRDVFLDDEPTVAAITRQLQLALTIANRQGVAVAIGHPYPATLSVLENLQPHLIQHKVSLVFVSQLLQKPEAEPHRLPSASYCPAPPIGLWFIPVIDIKLADISAATLLKIIGNN